MTFFDGSNFNNSEIKAADWWDRPMLMFTHDKKPNSLKAWLKAFWNTDIFVHQIPLLKLTLAIVILINWL